jgi:hypothetical protein
LEKDFFLGTLVPFTVFSHKKKEMKVHLDKYQRGIYCQNCNNDDHNTNHYPSKMVGDRCPSREIVLVHVVQVEAPIIQE